MVRGRLWRRSNPALSDECRAELVTELMNARRIVGSAGRSGDTEAVAAARTRVHAAKVALGERGPVWWNDGAPDLNRHMARTTRYAEWFAALPSGQAERHTATATSVRPPSPKIRR